MADRWRRDLPPEPIIIINFKGRTVTGFTMPYWDNFTVKVTAMNDVGIVFSSDPESTRGIHGNGVANVQTIEREYHERKAEYCVALRMSDARRHMMPKAAAPYLHPQLSAVPHRWLADGQPIAPTVTITIEEPKKIEPPWSQAAGRKRFLQAPG